MMRIKQLHIYGFGKWQDQSWELDEERITMIMGENEAGKSTIRAFILFILFGLPPRERERYLPKRGGQLGGRLVVQATDGADYTIERLHDRLNGEAVCYDEAGKEQSENWLNEELNGMDRKLFNQIFNFDVFSLQIEKGISEEQLGEVLLSVGMTGSDRIYKAENELKKVLDAKFLPRGSKPELNQLINQLIDQDQELKQLEDSVTAYQEHQKKSQAYQAEIRTARAELGELDKLHRQFSKQREIYPSIESYHLLAQQLDEFPEEMDFPEEGEVRYREAKDKLQPIVAEQEVAKKQAENSETDLQQLKEQLLPEQTISQIRTRLEQSGDYQEQLNEKKQLERQIDEKNQAIKTQLNELKLDLSEDELRELSINYTTQQKWQSLAEEVDQTTKELSEKEQALDALQSRQTELETNILDLETKTLSEREKQAAEEELNQHNQWFNDDPNRENEPKKWQSSHRTFSLAALGILVISIILLLTSDNSLVNGVLLGLIAIVAFVFGWQQIKFNRKWLDLVNKQTNEQSSKRTERRDELVKKLTLHDNHRDQLLLARDQFEKNKAEHLNVAEDIRRLKRVDEQLEEKIAEEQTKFPFLKILAVSFWPDLAKRLVGLIELIEERSQLTKALNEIRPKIEQFEEETIEEFDDLLERENQKFQEHLERLKTLSIQYQQETQREETLTDRLVEQKNRVEELTAKMRPYQDEIDHLLKQAKVESEDEFIALARRFKEWSELKDKQEEALRQIQLYMPKKVADAILAGEFLTEKELEEKVTTIDAEMAELKEDLNEWMQKEADEQAILKQLAHSKEVVNLKHDFYFTEDKFIEASKEWLVNKIAAEKIAQTKAVFQTSYLPVVLERATEFFTKLTDQRYSQIDFDQSNQQIFLLAKDQQTYRFDELSQGTLDQLFVAIRLGISSWLAEHIQLPFLIDDGFVHFDANRKELVLEILDELATEHQIIYFTKEPDFPEQKSHHFINLS